MLAERVIMSSLSRRRFLKISSATMGLAAAGGALSKVGRSVAEEADPAQLIRKVPTFCDICFWKCGAIAYVKDGRLWKVEGNPEDPLSRGRLCPRGTGGVGAHVDPDRLRTPLVRRTNARRGQEEWAAVTWDEA